MNFIEQNPGWFTLIVIVAIVAIFLYNVVVVIYGK